MPAFLAPLLELLNVGALGTTALSHLMSQGLPEESEVLPGGKVKVHQAVSGETIQDEFKRAVKSHGEKAAKAVMNKQYGRRRAARAMRGPGLGSKALGVAGGAGTLLFLASMLKPDLFMPSMEDMGLPPTGGEGDIMELLAGLQGAAESGVETRNEEAFTRGLVNMLDRKDMLGARAQMGGTADLDELIRGNEQLLGQIAYREPMSLAQAYAMHGLYAPQEPTRVDFGDIL